MGSSRDSVLSLGPMLHSQKGFEIWFCSSLVSVLLAEFKQSQSIGGCDVSINRTPHWPVSGTSHREYYMVRACNTSSPSGMAWHGYGFVPERPGNLLF